MLGEDVDDAGKLVSTDPEVMGGMVCFKGTRVSIENVLASLDRGISWLHVVHSYPFLTEAHVDAAQAYISDHTSLGRLRRTRRG